MSLSLPHKLAVATAAMFGALEAIGIVLYARSYVDVMASGVVVENWSVFLVQFLINVVALVFSAIGFFGGLIGVLLGYPFVNTVIGRLLEENMGNMFPQFRVQPGIALLGLALAIVLAVVAAVLPARQAASLKVVDALRRVG